MAYSYYKSRPHISEEHGFFEGKGGSIEIQYHDYSRKPLLYKDLSVLARVEKRVSVGSYTAMEQAEKTPPVPFRRIRLTPEQAKKQGYKYKSPSKHQTGEQINSPLYIPLTLPRAEIDTLFLTEGEIKAHIACLHSVPTVAFAGIFQAVKNEPNPDCYSYGRQPYETLKPELLEIPFRRICVLFDSDAATKNTAAKRRQFLSAAIKICRAWFAAGDDRELHFGVVNPSQPHKGLDDVLLAAPETAKLFLKLKHTPAALIERMDAHSYAEQLYKLLLNRGQHFLQGEAEKFLLSDAQISITRVGRGERYVADAIDAEQSENAFIIAQTGTGKTSFVYKNLVSWQIPCIVCVPMQSQVLGFAAKAADLSINPRNVRPELHFEGQKIDPNAQGMPELIVTTYDSLPALATQLKGKFGAFCLLKYRLVLDEAHNFVTSASRNYKLLQFSQAAEYMEDFGAVTALSGTYIPVPHPAFSELRILEFNSPLRPVPLQVVEARSVTQYAALRINKALQAGHKVICLLNNKKLRGKTLYSSVKSNFKAMLNADTKDSQEYADLVQRSTMGGVDYIQATKLIQEGLDIFDTQPTLYVVLGGEHPADVWQLVNRHRKAEVACLWVIGRKHGKAKFAGYNYALNAEELYSAAEQGKYNSDFGAIPELQKFVQAKDYFTRSHIYYKGARNWGINSLEMANTAFQEQRKMAHSSVRALKNCAAFWGFDVTDADFLADQKIESDEQAKELAREEKQRRDEEMEEVKAMVRAGKHGEIRLLTYDFAKEVVKVFALSHIPPEVQDQTILAVETVAGLKLWRKRNIVADRIRNRNRTSDADFYKFETLKRYLLRDQEKPWTGFDLLGYYNKYAPRKVHTVTAAVAKLRLIVDVRREGGKKSAVYFVSRFG